MANVLLKHGGRVRFDYTKKDGEHVVVNQLHVDQVYTSKDGYEIVTGFLDDAGQDARAYRVVNIDHLTTV